MAEHQTSHNCINCPSRQSTEWRDLDANELEIINHAKRTKHLEPGDVLFHQGDDTDGVYCIQSGLLGVRRSDENGDSLLLRLAAGGTTVGYRAFLSKQNHSNSVEALTNSTVCFIESSQVRRLLASNPQIGERFLQHTISDLGETEKDYAQAMTLNLKLRLLNVLMSLYERIGYTDTAGNLTIDLPMKKSDLAALLGVQPESLSRALKSIESEGLIDFHGHKIIFTNMNSILTALGPVE